MRHMEAAPRQRDRECTGGASYVEDGPDSFKMAFDFSPAQSTIDALVSRVSFFFGSFGIPPLPFAIEVCFRQAHFQFNGPYGTDGLLEL